MTRHHVLTASAVSLLCSLALCAPSGANFRRLYDNPGILIEDHTTGLLLVGCKDGSLGVRESSDDLLVGAHGSCTPWFSIRTTSRSQAGGGDDDDDDEEEGGEEEEGGIRTVQLCLEDEGCVVDASGDGDGGEEEEEEVARLAIGPPGDALKFLMVDKRRHSVFVRWGADGEPVYLAVTEHNRVVLAPPDGDAVSFKFRPLWYGY